MNSEFVSGSEAAAILGLSAHHVYVLGTTGKLPSLRTGYARIYKRADVLSLAAERAANPPKRGGYHRRDLLTA